jgi:hypothetical protein
MRAVPAPNATARWAHAFDAPSLETPRAFRLCLASPAFMDPAYPPHRHDNSLHLPVAQGRTQRGGCGGSSPSTR